MPLPKHTLQTADEKMDEIKRFFKTQEYEDMLNDTVAAIICEMYSTL
jgi:hypothetical protein